MSFMKNTFSMGKQGRQQNAEHKQNRTVSCLKQGSEINGFCLKQGLKASAAHAYPNFP